ncbi:hypothetical protein [Streptomyces sp. NRRL S-337]|nr:hypothetical protein [Streptomyces sp. NRRL S-337]
MAIKKLPTAAGDVVAVLGAVGDQHGVEQGPVAVLSAGEPPADNTPWS